MSLSAALRLVQRPAVRVFINAAGPLRVEGAYVCGAVSGCGLMASAAVGELAAAHMAGRALPDCASAFSIERQNDPVYRRRLENWRPTGQL